MEDVLEQEMHKNVWDKELPGPNCVLKISRRQKVMTDGLYYRKNKSSTLELLTIQRNPEEPCWILMSVVCPFGRTLKTSMQNATRDDFPRRKGSQCTKEKKCSKYKCLSLSPGKLLKVLQYVEAKNC